MTETSGDYIEISLPIDGEAAEAVSELFERHGGGAVIETRMVAGPEEGSVLPQPEHWIRTYIPAQDVEARARVEEGLWHLSQIHPIPEASIKVLAEANWAESWKSHFTPQRVGERFLIVPTWIDPEPRPGDHVIRLDPGMAFGTGLHPTTRLCLAALEACVAPGSAVLDVGTGSGILAIAAAQLGAARVVAVDISAEAVRVARRNAEANGVSVEVSAGSASELGDARFDVVVANLLATTVSESARQLYESAHPGGRLIASGILGVQAPGVRDALCAAGFVAPVEDVDGDWSVLVADRPERAA